MLYCPVENTAPGSDAKAGARAAHLANVNTPGRIAVGLLKARAGGALVDTASEPGPAVAGSGAGCLPVLPRRSCLRSASLTGIAAHAS